MSTPLVRPIPYFMRAWHIGLRTRDGQHYAISSSNMDNPLRVQFEVEQYMGEAFWQASVRIFNMELIPDVTSTITDARTGATIPYRPAGGISTTISQYDELTISAGYERSFDSQAPLIYKGDVFQPIWSRENMVDSITELRCMTGLLQYAMGFVSFSLAPGSTDADAVRQICANGNIPIEYVDWDALEQRRHPGCQVYYGRPLRMLAQIAKGNHMSIWTSPMGLNMRHYSSLSKGPGSQPDIIYAPAKVPAPEGAKPTIIGVPAGTQKGVNFRVLLDSQVKVGSFIQIARGTTIAAYPFTPRRDLPPLTSRDGLYMVIGVRHVGDSRGQGDDWYSEIEAVTWDYFSLVLKAVTPS